MKTVATGSIFEITTSRDYFTDIFETIVKMKHTIMRILLCKRLSNEKFIEIDLVDDRNVLIIL